MIVVYGKIRARSGNEAAVLAAAKTIIEHTRHEDGVLEYSFYTDVLDPQEFSFVEVWRDNETLAAHSGTEHLAQFREAVYPLLESRNVQVYEGNRLR